VKSLESIPTAPGSRPLLGHALPLMRDPLRFLRSLPAHGDLVQVLLGPHPAIVVCDPALARHVLVNDRTFDKGGIYDVGRQALGSSLITCPYYIPRS
jgi:cytochrome P450